MSRLKSCWRTCNSMIWSNCSIRLISASSTYLLGKEGKTRGTPLAPRQGRSPAPPFPIISSVFALSLDVVEFLFEVLPAERSRWDNGLKSRHPLLGDLSQIVGHFFG